MDFFVYLSEGAVHGQNVAESKLRQQFNFKNFFRLSTLLLCVEKSFVSEKTQKSEIYHFSQEIYA